MDKGRKVRVKKSVITTLALQLTTLICGLIVPRFMLNTYGSEAYGATTSIAQFLSYITLLEGGIGGVARAALYKPLAQKDTTKISAIVYELKFFFRIIALISIGYAFILACLFKSISHIECYDWFGAFLLVFAIAISTFGQYFIGIAYSALIQADQRVYIINALSIFTTILNTIITIFLINLGSRLIVVKLVSSFVFLIKPTVMWLYVERKYGLIKGVTRDKKSLEQRWTGLGQHLAYYIHSNTDVAVLTFLVGLKTVSVYSVYHMVTSNIQNVISSLWSGMEALFGDMIAKQQIKQLKDTFFVYETIISIVCTVFFSTVYVMIVPFINLYTRGITDINYEQPVFAFLITTASTLYCIRFPYQSVITAAGHFKQTRFAAYGEAGINIILSILLVWKYGLIGVAIGTIVAISFRLLYSVFYLSNNIMFRDVSLFIKRLIVNAICIIIIVGICKKILLNLQIVDYLKWIFCSAIVFIFSGLITFIINEVFYRNSMITFFNVIFKRIK